MPLAGHSTERSTTVGATEARAERPSERHPGDAATDDEHAHQAECCCAWRSRIAQGARPDPNYDRPVPRAGAEERSEVRLLGPVEVICGWPPRHHRRQPCQDAAAPARHAGPAPVVDSSALTEAVWGDHAPRTAAHALHVHASTVRRALGSRGDWLQARPPGYVLALDPEPGPRLTSTILNTPLAMAEPSLRVDDRTPPSPGCPMHWRLSLDLLWRTCRGSGSRTPELAASRCSG